jgi:hypothetical protein
VSAERGHLLAAGPEPAHGWLALRRLLLAQHLLDEDHQQVLIGLVAQTQPADAKAAGSAGPAAPGCRARLRLAVQEMLLFDLVQQLVDAGSQRLRPAAFR